MSNPALIVRKLVAEHREEMSDAARELHNRSSWDLQCPVIVIDARVIPKRVLKTSVRGLTGTITTSNVIENPLLKSFLKRVREVGVEDAHDERMSSPDSDQVLMLWERYTDEQLGLRMAVWSYSDAAQFALKSKQCFQQGEIACVAITEGSTGADYGILTFSVNSSWLS